MVFCFKSVDAAAFILLRRVRLLFMSCRLARKGPEKTGRRGSHACSTRDAKIRLWERATWSAMHHGEKQCDVKRKLVIFLAEVAGKEEPMWRDFKGLKIP